VSFLKPISNSSLSDHDLVLLYRQTADLQVLAQLYSRYMDLVYGVCLKYLKNPENAKDSTLAIFEDLIVKLKKHEVTHFKSWLYQVSKNHCLMQLRSEKKWSKANVEVQFVQNEAFVHLNGELDKEAYFEQLEFCLSQLNNEQRQVVELFYLQGKSYKEIEVQLSIDVNTVRSYLQNGRRNLKICMDKQKEALL
jgi:RNA polymerase sigma factor (sigma-70 family)